MDCVLDGEKACPLVIADPSSLRVKVGGDLDGRHCQFEEGVDDRDLDKSGALQWDTANVRSNGDSERISAKSFKKYDIPPHKMVHLMKLCWRGRRGA